MLQAAARQVRLARHRLVPGLSSLQGRCMCAAAPTENPDSAGEDDDMVIAAFKEQQRQYQTVLEGMKDIKVPLAGDEGAIRKYAQEMESLKKKAGVPDMSLVVNAKLEYALECSGFNVRSFIGAAAPDLAVSESDPVLQDLLQAVEDIEQETGAPLDADNEDGWLKLASVAQDIEQKHGLTDTTKLEDDAIFESYKAQIEHLRQVATDEMEAAKRRDGLEWVNVSLSELNPKPAIGV